MFMLARPILEQALTEQSIRVSVCCLCSLHPCTVSDNGWGHLKSPRCFGLSLRVTQTAKSNQSPLFCLTWFISRKGILWLLRQNASKFQEINELIIRDVPNWRVFCLGSMLQFHNNVGDRFCNCRVGNIQ